MTPSRVLGLFGLTIGVLVVGVLAPRSARAEPPTWNPQGKESPEPYGYDVYSAPDLPLGYVDPDDPPARFAVPLPKRPGAGLLAVTTTVDRSAYSWFGAIVVTAAVSQGDRPSPTATRSRWCPPSIPASAPPA
ncbi:MAG: hypothetical protein R3E12_01635 [Candidatus Eisenbacteria bacterium]